MNGPPDTAESLYPRKRSPKTRRRLPPLSGSTLAGLNEREHWRRFARKERFVYVARFASEIVKVGYTDYPERRFGELAWAAGDSIVRAWASVLHLNAVQNERELIAFCGREGRRAGRAYEFFRDVELEGVVAFAEGLPFEQTPDAEADVQMERHKQWLADGCPLPSKRNSVKDAQAELPLGGEA